VTGLRVIGLDLSTAASGMAQTHDSTGQPRLSVRTIDTAKRPLHDQIDMIEMAVRKACGWVNGFPAWPGHRPDLVVVEGTFSREGGSDYPLHAVRANVLQWLHRQRIPYVDVQPLTLKMWATGSGATRGKNKVSKAGVCAAIVATYGRFLHINPRDDNCCDAVALLTMGLAAYGQPLADVPETHRRALASISTWPTLKTGALS
jgi:crossover junction endodeoxyribonuclease RuvC